jgi:hypothetical protein
VPGLAAKPVLDIAAGRPADTPAAAREGRTPGALDATPARPTLYRETV